VSRLESDYYAYMGYDSEHARGGLRHYLPWLTEGPILELAPGRGEMLGLLRDAGVPAWGVDLDDGMVESAAAQGLDVRLGDALDAIRTATPASLGGVFCAHLVEHLQPESVAELIEAAARALRPGGHFVAVTPNAACASVMGHDFWRDPTHVRFYDADLLAFYCARAGLEIVQTGGNPLNTPGPPPPTRPHPVTVEPDMAGELATALTRIADPKGRGKTPADSPWYVVNHYMGALTTRLQRTQEELRELHGAYESLLRQLYPSNEIYVVGRRA
jgi:SAM-dependent methyltransferase